MSSTYEKRLLELIQSNNEIMKDLAMIRQLNLPDWYVAAGFIRNYVWDHLHGYADRTPLNDIDIIYYDTEHLDEAFEKQVENQLLQETGISLWSVKNQARMHLKEGNEPYKSSMDAIRYWPETATAVGIRLEKDDRLSIICPYGLDDIFECRVRKSPLFKDKSYYQARVAKKNWNAIWPKLQIT